MNVSYSKYIHKHPKSISEKVHLRAFNITPGYRDLIYLHASHVRYIQKLKVKAEAFKALLRKQERCARCGEHFEPALSICNSVKEIVTRGEI